MRYLLSNLVALDVVVDSCQYAQGKNLGQHPGGRIRVRISVAEMFNEVLTRFSKFSIDELLCLREGAGIIETRRVGHPKGIACLAARYVDDGTTDGNLYLLYLVEHQQSQMPVETVHIQCLVERGTGFENMVLLRGNQKRIEISAESIISDMTKIVLCSCCILDE